MTTMRMETVRQVCTLAAAFGAIALGGVADASAQIVADAGDDELSAEITGRVLDASTGEPVWNAFVHLADWEDGTFTDSEGDFLLPVPTRPNYTVVAEQLGYADIMAGVQAGEAGTPLEIRIEPDPVALEAIEVVADRFSDRRNAFGGGSVTYLDQAEILRRHGGRTAEEMARDRAMLHACGGGTHNYWCAWDGGDLVAPRVFVDGRPMPWSGTEWLAEYAAEEIYLMEIYDRGRFIQVVTRWGVEENPRRIAALRLMPMSDFPAGFGEPPLRTVGINRAPTGLYAP